MDISSILEMGVKMLQKNGINADSDTIASALNKVVGSGDSMDIGSMLSSFSEGGLGNIVSSWLGSGENAAISPSALMDMLGSDKVASFASELGVSEDTALEGLSGTLPEMVDNASPGGSLLDSVGGVSGAMDMAKKFFG